MVDTAEGQVGLHEAPEVDMSAIELEPERVARNLALHLAAADGNVDECKVLLDGEGEGEESEGGADAWWEDESYLNWSALHFAAHGGHTEVVRLLLRRGAIWNAGEQGSHALLQAEAGRLTGNSCSGRAWHDGSGRGLVLE